MADNNNIIVYLNGKDKPSFRCSCGCNVFHHPELSTWEDQMETYECNSCGIRYKGK